MSTPPMELIRSDRGRKKLVLEGFLYAHDRLCMDGREMWRCDRRTECKARIHTQGGRLIQRINEHTHGPDTDKIRQAKSYMEVIRLNGEVVSVDQSLGYGVSGGISVEESGSELGDNTWLKSIGLSGEIKQETLEVDVGPTADSAPRLSPQPLRSGHQHPAGLPVFGGAFGATQDSPETGAPSTSSVSPSADCMVEAVVDPMFADPHLFWENCFKAGAMDELIQEIGNHLERYRTTFRSRPDLRPHIAAKLSGIVNLMDISGQIKAHLNAKKLLTLAETDILQNEIKALERKALEQKKRQLEAKRKASIFQQLIASPVVSHPSTSRQQPQYEEITIGEPPCKKLVSPNHSAVMENIAVQQENLQRMISNVLKHPQSQHQAPHSFHRNSPQKPQAAEASSSGQAAIAMDGFGRIDLGNGGAPEDDVGRAPQDEVGGAPEDEVGGAQQDEVGGGPEDEVGEVPEDDVTAPVVPNEATKSVTTNFFDTERENSDEC